MSFDQHDRTYRFMRSVYPWPDVDALSVGVLQETAREVVVTISAREVALAQQQLTLLAMVNVLGRLPIQLVIDAPDCRIDRSGFLSTGAGLHEAIESIADQLGSAMLVRRDAPAGPVLSVEVADGVTSHSWGLGSANWDVHIGDAEAADWTAYNPASAYALACHVAAEACRAWARATGRRLGLASDHRVCWLARPLAAHVQELWPDGPAVDSLTLPAIDWVSAGAVNQAALAVLAEMPVPLHGAVYDNKELDPPDLNRSLLSFRADMGVAKAVVAARCGDALLPFVDKYPEGGHADNGRFIVSGTDDVRVRPALQRLRPDELIVIATEGAAARVTHHRLDGVHICAGCQYEEVPETTEPFPTCVATSGMAGVVGAVRVLQVAAGIDPPRRTDLYTLRMGPPVGVEESCPPARPDCDICGRR